MSKVTSSFRLPAEWENQSGVLITWPHEDTDWNPILNEIEATYLQLSKAITRFEKLLIIVISESHQQSVTRQLQSYDVDLSQIIFSIQTTDDTWTRDYGPLTTISNQQITLQDFVFNGWGNKFDAHADNVVNKKLFDEKTLRANAIKQHMFVLEGGSIDVNNLGDLLTTSDCLLTDTRNPDFSREDIEQYLKESLGIKHILWLESGYLAGDDTDSHIDMLARFVNENTITYVKCHDENDEHFTALQAMENELKALQNQDGEPYRLIELPFPDAVIDEGRRLPASYANFLIINGAVLVPTYNDKKDAEALKILDNCFPEREIIGINFSSAIKQNGSLHCLTMQLPEGVI